MAIKRTIGSETEYGILGTAKTVSQYTLADRVVDAYIRGQNHFNSGDTNESVIEDMTDDGHVGGDYGAGRSISVGASGAYPASSGWGRNYDYGYQGTHVAYRTTYVAPATTCASHDVSKMIENGSRFYVDMGHPELSTPECAGAVEFVIYDKAGEVIVNQAAKKASNPRNKITIFKNNSDGKGKSFGCHENYLMQRMTQQEFANKLAPILIPFFVTRQIFTGSGKIGVEKPSGQGGIEHYRRDILKDFEILRTHFIGLEDEYSIVRNNIHDLFKLYDKRVGSQQEIFQLSQRADFMECRIGLQTTYDRPLVNTRDEPHADKEKYMRLHVIVGDANMSEIADYLKVGTTSLVLDLIEDNLFQPFQLMDPVTAIKSISRDQSMKWITSLKNGKTVSAIDIQRWYLAAAKNNYAGRDEITDDILARWEYVLDTLEKDPMELSGWVDWVLKKAMIQDYMVKNQVPINDPAVKNLALQFHDVDRETSLFYLMQRKGFSERLISDEQILNAVNNPPENTRAYFRGMWLKKYDIDRADWGELELTVNGTKVDINIDDPFKGTKKDYETLFEKCANAEEAVEELKKEEYDVTVDEKTQSWVSRGIGFVKNKITGKGKKKAKSKKKSTKKTAKVKSAKELATDLQTKSVKQRQLEILDNRTSPGRQIGQTSRQLSFNDVDELSDKVMEQAENDYVRFHDNELVRSEYEALRDIALQYYNKPVEEIFWNIGYEEYGSYIRIEGRHVVQLNLRYQNLVEIPEQITSFNKLRHLDLEGNEITEVSYVADLEELTYIDLQGNPIDVYKSADVLNELHKREVRIRPPKLVDELCDLNLEDSVSADGKEVYEFNGELFVITDEKEQPQPSELDETQDDISDVVEAVICGGAVGNGNVGVIDVGGDTVYFHDRELVREEYEALEDLAQQYFDKSADEYFSTDLRILDPNCFVDITNSHVACIMLCDTGLEEIPEQISKLSKLLRLHIGYNKISDIECTDQLKSLDIFGITDNPLNAKSKTIVDLLDKSGVNII